MCKKILICIFLFLSTIAYSQQNRFFYTSTFIDHFLDTTRKVHTSVQIPLEPILNTQKDTNHSFLYRKLFNEHHALLKGSDYALSLDFIPEFLIGFDQLGDQMLWLNTRGFAVQAELGDNFYFYSDLYENQGVFPQYLDTTFARQLGINGQALLRPSLGKALDYSYATAFMEYQASKFLTLQLGYGKNFIGNGYRSLLLSDIAPNYPYLNVDLSIGPLFYRAHYAQHIDPFSPVFSYDNGYRKKYASMHYLDWNINSKLSIGLYESVIWQEADSNGKRGFDFQYINPIIFLRPIEFAIGSPDNALIGVNVVYKVLPKTSLYGMFLLDEFRAQELFANTGWWANKYAGQIGIRGFDVFNIRGFHGLSEFNFAMPYTYSQRSSLLNYGHLGQSLAHPLGANFRESVTQIRYINNKFTAAYQFSYAFQGLDSTGNVGQNIFQSYNTRDKEYENFLGQGIKSTTSFHQFTFSYLLNPVNNWRIECSIGSRTNNTLIQESDLFFTFGIRSSFRSLYYDY